MEAMETALIRLNTDDVKQINFLKFQTVVLKEWNKDKTQCSYSRLTARLNVYPIEFNFTKKTVKIGRKVFHVKEYTEFVYNFSGSTVKCWNMDNLYKSFREANNSESVFHTMYGSVLKNIISKQITP